MTTSDVIDLEVQQIVPVTVFYSFLWCGCLHFEVAAAVNVTPKTDYIVVEFCQRDETVTVVLNIEQTIV